MTTLKSDRFTLMRGDSAIGEIEIRDEDADFPWYGGIFTPSESFSEVRALFSQELELLHHNIEEWDRVYGQISAPGLTLISNNKNQEISNLLIHVDGEKVWFRC